MSRTPRSKTLALAAGLAALIAGAFAAPARADDYGDAQPAGYDTGYSYIRVLEGAATLIQGSALDGDGGDRAQAEVNQPVLAGDRLWVGPRSRAEVLLSDRNLLRLDGETELAFEQLAFSPESTDRVTTLRLLRGNAQLVVASESLGEQLPRVDTLNAAIYPQDFGVYRITTDGGDWTEVVVRRGRAEVVSGGETVAVAAGDRALVDGREGRWADVRSAGGFDGLERWADELGRRAEAYDVPYVDEDLRYAAAPLEDHGRWVEVSGSYAWRPRVDTGWRPYWHGRWAYTPAGVTWVSSEPWGWVPYHYGTWDYASGYGWVWFPGRRFSPAWVYWHWGSSHVAWVPVGYYTRHYRHGYPGFRSGVYGWAGGDPGYFADWVFCDRGSFGRRRHGHNYYRGHEWRRHHGGHAVPRGILTTDTRPLRPSLWDDPDGSVRALRSRPGIGGRRGLEADLPDVTAFVTHRGGELPTEVATRVAITRGEVDRVAGTPLAPGTRGPEVRLARPSAGIRGGGSAGTDDAPRTVVTPGVRSSRPGSDLSGEASGAPDRDRGSLSATPRARTSRPVVQRQDAPRAESPRAQSPGSDSPRRDEPAAGRPGTVIRRTPPAAGAESSGGSDDRDSLSDRRTVRPRDGGGAQAAPPSSGGSLSGSSPRAERPSRPEGSAASEPGGRSGIAVRSPRAERPSPPPGTSRGDDRSSLGGRAPAPRAERPTAVRPRAIEPWGVDRRGSSPSTGSPGTTVRRSAPPPSSSSPRAERPPASRPPAADRAPSSGLRAPAPRREPTARTQPAPSRPPVVRSAPAPSRPPVVRSAPAPSRPPVVRSTPSRPAPSARTQPSRPSAPRSTPSAGSSSRGDGGRSAPRAESGSSRGGGGGGGDRGAARSRGGGRSRG